MFAVFDPALGRLATAAHLLEVLRARDLHVIQAEQSIITRGSLDEARAAGAGAGGGHSCRSE